MDAGKNCQQEMGLSEGTKATDSSPFSPPPAQDLAWPLLNHVAKPNVTLLLNINSPTSFCRLTVSFFAPFPPLGPHSAPVSGCSVRNGPLPEATQLTTHMDRMCP